MVIHFIDAPVSGGEPMAIAGTLAIMMLADNYKPGFRIDLHIKDLTNALNTGAMCDAPLPLTNEMLDILKKLSAGGDGSSDHSAIAKHYEELAGTLFSK